MGIETKGSFEELLKVEGPIIYPKPDGNDVDEISKAGLQLHALTKALNDDSFLNDISFDDVEVDIDDDFVEKMMEATKEIRASYPKKKIICFPTLTKIAALIAFALTTLYVTVKQLGDSESRITIAYTNNSSFDTTSYTEPTRGNAEMDVISKQQLDSLMLKLLTKKANTTSIPNKDTDYYCNVEADDDDEFVNIVLYDKNHNKIASKLIKLHSLDIMSIQIELTIEKILKEIK